MSLEHWVIEDGVMKRATLAEWAAWFECAERWVAYTTISTAKISTVFLGLDMQWSEGRPMYFETMVFDDKLPDLHPGFWSGSMARYGTIEEAKRGHRVFVEKVREFYPDAPVENKDYVLGRIPPDKQARYDEILRKMRED